MKFAFLITAHNDFDQLKRLIESIREIGDSYILIDKKVDNDFFEKVKTISCKNVCVIEDIINISWGGFSIVVGQKLLLRHSILSNKKYDYFIFLSGLCYPIYSNKQIKKYFEENKGKEFVSGYNITRSNDKLHLSKVVNYHFFRDNFLKLHSIPQVIINRVSKFIAKYLWIKKSPYILIREKRWEIYYGSQWSALSCECAEYVYNELCNNKELIKYFSTSFAPDELCIPTIVFNSKFKTKAFEIDKNDFSKNALLHYLNYSTHIWIYDEKDYQTLINSGKMFVRKLVSDKSEKLIEMLKERKKHLI